MTSLKDWLNILEQRHPKSIDLGLERCGEVYRRMGRPRPARHIYTVAGTNGKGSTVAYLAALNGAAGLKVGTYTSPHILRFNERVTISGTVAEDELFIQAFEQVENARGDVSLTYFEFTTLAAFFMLSRASLDCAVLEVGLGGRLDTVNLVDTDCAVITPIGLDHQNFLGNDLQSIAAEKAGIIRQNTPLVCTEISPPAAVMQRAAECRSQTYLRGRDYDLKLETSGLIFLNSVQEVKLSELSMGGEHQQDNLAAALQAFSLFNPLDPVLITKAIADCRLAGRLQLINEQPLILVDVGHNELAAKAVAVYLQSRPASRTTCILGMLKDKTAELVVKALQSSVNQWICVGTAGDRGQTGKDLFERINPLLDEPGTLVFDSVAEAMNDILHDFPADETILIFGSFSLVEETSRWHTNHMQHQGLVADRITSGT